MSRLGGSRDFRPRALAIGVIVLSQWLGTSLWFSPSGATEDLSAWLNLDAGGFGWLLAATQLGFIVGTFISTITGAADRFSPEKVFAISSVLGALLNSVWSFSDPSMPVAWLARFGVGVALAGIYPMGMKMIVQRVGGNPGSALGLLVAMLTLGTAMPQVLRALGASLPWQAVIWGSSILAIIGAILVILIQEPRTRHTAAGTKSSGGNKSVRSLLTVPAFRSASFGYFGHMWELYAFWSVVPLLAAELVSNAADVIDVATLSAVVIAAGSLGSILGGFLSQKYGSAAVAAVALGSSGLICLVYPFINPEYFGLKVAALALWSFFVIADSPQFSALASRVVPAHLVGTALTSMNSVGFLLTAVSIVALQNAMALWGEFALWILVPGPLLGLVAMRPLLKSRTLTTEQSECRPAEPAADQVSKVR